MRTVYGDLLLKSPYSVRIPKNTDQKKLCFWTLFAQWAVLKRQVRHALEDIVFPTFGRLSNAPAWKMRQNFDKFF